jgi:predicted metal-dependent enzyme (double-stranded beta helix superfamily)
MGDLLSIGTMVCGASAINALSPVVNARRRDQGLAITSVFLFSIVALMAFYPLAQGLGLSDDFGGLWAGLAVNDLSSSVAVGDQFSSDASVIAAAAKSVRIILLGPMLVFFSILRPSTRGETVKGTKASWTAHFPMFILGYFLFFGLRLLGDAQFGESEQWGDVIWWNSFTVKMLILMVCVGIGLQIRVKTIIELGWKAVVTGACASVGVAGLSLAMLYFFSNEQGSLAIASGGLCLVLAAGLYFLGASEGAKARSLIRTLESSAPLSLRETTALLDLFDRRDELSKENISRVLKRTYPAIGEIQPLRTTALIPPIQYRRLIYWVSSKGSGSLVGILWAPGAVAHIHSHGYNGLGKTIEGQLEDTQYRRCAEDELEVVSREVLDPELLIEFKMSETIHSVRNLSDRDAIHVHFYGPEKEQGLRFDPMGSAQPNELAVGAQFRVKVGADQLPQTVLETDQDEDEDEEDEAR